MKQLRQCFFVQVGTDHAQAAGIVGAAVTDDDLPGNIVKLEPFPGCVLQDSLGAEDPAVFLLIRQPFQDGTDFILLVALRGFQADIAEDFVRVMFPFAMMMVMMVFVVMAVMAAFMIMIVFMLMMVMLMPVMIIVPVIIVIIFPVFIMMEMMFMMKLMLMMMFMLILIVLIIVVIF